MTSYDNFKILLKIGNAVEVKAQQRILNYYENKYTIPNTCNNNQYDFMLSNEVKFNRLAHKTNNIFIEVIQFGSNNKFRFARNRIQILCFSCSEF